MNKGKFDLEIQRVAQLLEEFKQINNIDPSIFTAALMAKGISDSLIGGIPEGMLNQLIKEATDFIYKRPEKEVGNGKSSDRA